MEDNGYSQLNRSWKNTCRILLGTEVGNLLEFENYLKKYTNPIDKRRSAISGDEVTISSNKIPKDAKVIGYDEMKKYEEIAAKPLDINRIKDIDSILEALHEKAYYTGNIVLGNSSNTTGCHRCVNVNYALGCQDVYDGKYVAFTTSIRNPEYSFGCCFGGDIQFCVKVLDPYKQMRCLETFHCNVASDCYYVGSVDDCSNCMFTFNQKNKQYMIGNVPLNKDAYLKLKNKLVDEIADSMRKNKSLPSVIQIISGKGDWNGK